MLSSLNPSFGTKEWRDGPRHWDRHDHCFTSQISFIKTTTPWLCVIQQFLLFFQRSKQNHQLAHQRHVLVNKNDRRCRVLLSLRVSILVSSNTFKLLSYLKETINLIRETLKYNIKLLALPSLRKCAPKIVRNLVWRFLCGAWKIGLLF